MTRTILLTITLSAVAGCNPKPDRETQCQQLVEHMRKVSAMPMRDGDVMKFTGACAMFKQSTVDCLKTTTNDADIKKCSEMER